MVLINTSSMLHLPNGKLTTGRQGTPIGRGSDNDIYVILCFCLGRLSFKP